MGEVKIIKYKLPTGTLTPIFDPDALKVLPRSKYMLTLVGNYGAPTVPLEELAKNRLGRILGLSFGAAPATPLKAKPRQEVVHELYNMANTYINYRDKHARLPAFSKWVASMFKDNKEFQTVLAEIGQEQNNSANLYISGNPIDIMRGTDSVHFSSCLRGPHPILRALVEEAPGTLVAYTMAEDGRMKGRSYIHEAVEEKTGKHVVVVNPPYGPLSATTIAKALRERDKDVLVVERNGGYGSSVSNIKWRYVNGLTKSEHYDFLSSNMSQVNSTRLIV